MGSGGGQHGGGGVIFCIYVLCSLEWQVDQMARRAASGRSSRVRFQSGTFSSFISLRCFAQFSQPACVQKTGPGAEKLIFFSCFQYALRVKK